MYKRARTLLSIELERRQHSLPLTEVIHSSWSYIKSHESEFYCELTRLITQHDSVVRDFLLTAKLIRALQLSLEQLDVTSPAEQQGVTSPAEQQGVTSPAEQQGVTSPAEQQGVTSPAEQQAVLGEVLQLLSSMTFDSSQYNSLIEDLSQAVNTTDTSVVSQTSV